MDNYEIGNDSWVQYTSLQFKMVSMHSEMPTCTPPHISELFPTSSLKRFQCLSDWQWPFLALSRKIAKQFLFLCLSPPGSQWCDVLGFVPAGSVSSSSTLQIFWDASHLWPLLLSTSLYARPFSSTQEQYIYKFLQRWKESQWFRARALALESQS